MEFLYLISIEHTLVTLVKYGIFLEFGIANYGNLCFFNHILAFMINYVHFTFLSVLIKFDGIFNSRFHVVDFVSMLLFYGN